MRWLPWCINAAVVPLHEIFNAAMSEPPRALPPPAHAPRYCIVTALGGQYGNDRFPWVATLCGDQPKLSSPVYFGSRPPAAKPERCAICEEKLAEQDQQDARLEAQRGGARARCGL